MNTLQCPFLAQTQVHYCSAFPVKKLIPTTDLKAQSKCVSGEHSSCPVFKDTGREATMLHIGAERNDCVWQNQSIISFRLCTLDYNCAKCQFEQSLDDREAYFEEPPEIVEAIRKMRNMPGHMRRCKYMLMAPVKAKPCENDYKCSECPTYLAIRDALHK